MGVLKLTLPGGQTATLPEGATPLEAARALGYSEEELEKFLVAQYEGQLWDLARPLPGSGHLTFYTFMDEQGRQVYRHTSAHILAQAVLRLFPEAKLATGPALEDRFYYDIGLEKAPSPEDLQRIEEEMKRIIQEDLPIVREEWPKAEARRFFLEKGQPFKVEIIDGIPGETVSIYRQGEFVDLCRGPHLRRTGQVGVIHILSVAGAYWRGDEKNPMLHRFYGTSFPTEEEWEHFQWVQEEARRRDHRKLGPELDLFSFHDVAPGFAFWHPKGWVIFRELENFSREVQARHGYQEVRTPYIFRPEIWQRSGHWDHYRQNMYVGENDGEIFSFKPMNCPAHCLLYAEKVRSYRDLPLRISEYGPLARCERSGTLHGLLRVRGFHQDDAHLFVREDQIGEELADVLSIVDEVYGTFGMEYRMVLSTRPEDYMGELSLWEKAEAQLADTLKSLGRSFDVNPGDGAFYGPKLDFYVTDALGRQWQTATVQLDFQLPIRFDLTYVAPDGSHRRPVMIHRAIFGSLERFTGILVEHFAGDFPLWLAPVQVRILPVHEGVRAYAHEVAQGLRAMGLRVEVDDREEKMGYRIRQAELERIPYMLVVGNREAAKGEVSVRSRRQGDEGARDWRVLAQELAERVKKRLL